MKNSQPYFDKTFHIIPGWAEGPWHSKRLVTTLKTAGFTETTANRATLVIAHSGGCYLLPKDQSNKLILLVGIPYWPGKSIFRGIIQKVRADMQINRFTFNACKGFWNIVYVLMQPYKSLLMWQATHKSRPLESIPSSAILIRNQSDTFCTPEISKQVPNKIISLPGQHDDLWHNPKPYVEIAENKYAKLLA
jgi:hypothetical protein